MNWKCWLYGLTAAAIGGGATSLSSCLGMAAAKSAGVNVPDLNLYADLIIFVSGAIVAVSNYLKQSPLPPVTQSTNSIKQ